MITAEFTKNGGGFSGFRISGHSGYADPGGDIVCSAVTAMVQLTVNAATEQFGAVSRLSVDESDAIIDFSFEKSDNVSALVSALCSELAALQSDYPDNVRVVVK